MIVLADTSPIRYLVTLGCESVLPALYGNVIIPEAVLRELSNPKAPAQVRAWLLRLPEWLHVDAVSETHDESLLSLGAGEREAIQLAQKFKADLLLIDEKLGTAEARRRNLRVAGTLGVLRAAGDNGLLDLSATLSQLFERTNFRISPRAKQEFLARYSITLR